MSDSSQPAPDRRRPDRHGRRRPDADLETLRSHPSLASLAGKGRQLDRLPTGRTAWALGGTLLVSMASLGPVSAGFVSVLAVLALAFTVSALSAENLSAARRVLDVTRVGLLAWVVVSAAVLWLDAPHDQAPGRTLTGPSAVADPRPTPAAGGSLGSLPGH